METGISAAEAHGQSGDRLFFKVGKQSDHSHVQEDKAKEKNGKKGSLA